MSQYIPGIVQYVPQVQPYRPDLNFYQKVLETKQAQYKAGYDQLSSLYGNLLDSPMLRSEDIDLRNKFFNEIGPQISKISSMDLSLPQNIEAASKVFQPLIDNKYIHKDMVYTKQAYNQLRQADNFRNCTNEKECGGKYWEGGVKAIQYQMQDFSKSSAEESLNFTAPRYTPAVNVAEKAMKFAKDMGFNMKTVSFTADGRYQVTTKNGTQMIPSLTDAFISTFQNDQTAVDYYNTKAYLSRKDFISSSVDQYGSEEAAENYYLDQMSKDLFTNNSQASKASQKDVDMAKRSQNITSQIIKDKGVDPNDPDDQNIIVSHNQSLVDEMIASTASDYYQQAADVVNPETISIVDAQAKRRRIDSAVSSTLFKNDLAGAATNYAMLTVEQDMKADPFAVAGFEHSLALDKMSKQFEYDVALDNLKTGNEILKKGYSDDGTGTGTDSSGNPMGMSSNSDANNYTADPTGLGGTDPDTDIRKTDQTTFQTVSDAMSADLYGYMTTTNNKLNQVARAAPGSYVGKVKVTPDMINWAKAAQKELFGQTSMQSVAAPTEEETPILDFLEYLTTDDIGLATAEKNKAKRKADRIVQVNAGGFLNENGDLVDPRQSTSFSDGNSANNWYKVTERLNSFVDNNPIAQSLFGDTEDLVKAKASSSNAQKTYFANLEKIKYNINGVQSALSSNRGNFAAKFDNPEYVKTQLDAFTANGVVKSEEQFVQDYVAGAPAKNRLKDVFLTMLPFGNLATDDYGTNEAEAKELYKQYSEMYSKVYNQSSDATVQFTDFKPLAAGYRKNASGAGVQADPVTVYNVDSAFRGDLGAKDFTQVYRNMQNAIKGGKNVNIYNVDGSLINEDYLNNFDDDDRVTSSKALNLIYSHIQGGRKKTDNDRARFDMTVHPIIGNDSNKVGFTIKLDQQFAEANSGTGKKEGATSGADAITIVMDKNDVTADAYQRLNKGSYATLMEAYGQVDIDEFSKYGGRMSITPNESQGGFNVNGTMKFYDPESGTFKDMVYSQASNPMASADMVAQGIAADLQILYAKNMQVSDYLRQANPNLIKDPAQIVQQ